MNEMKKLFTLAAAWLGAFGFVANAQNFFNLTASDVAIGDALPQFTHTFALDGRFSDSIYSVAIEYPEFVDMTAADISRYHNLTADTLPAMPEVTCNVGVARKRGQLDVSFVPLAFRDGKYQKLVSFKLAVKSRATGVRRIGASASLQASSR